MANAQLNATLTGNASSITTALNQANAGIQQINTNQQQTAQISQQTAQAQESLFTTMKKGAGALISNYMNISQILGDISGRIDEAYKRQARYTALLNHENYKKYEEQMNSIAKSHSSLINVYENSDTFQKLFNSNVDLSGEKLTQLTEISDSYAKAMGVDATEAMQRFSEAIAEASTSKLEDLGIYMDSDVVLRNYAISIGKAKDELTKAEEKQAMLNEILKNGKSSFEGMENPTQTYSASLKQLKQYSDELIVTTANLGAEFIDSLAPALNSFIFTWQTVGGVLYDAVHIFDSEVEVIKGDVIPATHALSNANLFLAKTINDVTIANKNLGVSGAITFQGIMADNQKAVEDTQKKYEDMLAKAEALREKIEASKYKRLEKEYQNRIALAKQTSETVDKFMTSDAVGVDDDFFEASDATIERLEKQSKEEIQLQKDKAKKLSEIEKQAADEKQFYENQKIKYTEMGVNAAADFSTMLINDVLLGEKELRKEMIGDFIKGIGTQMVADGTFHVFAGIAKGWGGNPLGWKEAQAGAVEVGVGVGLGATGKAIGTTSSKSEEKTKETAAMDRTNTKPQNQKTDVYLYPNEKPWLRRLNKSIKKIGSK